MSPEVYDAPTRLIHLLLALLGLAALISGQFADDYRRASHPGFDVHSVIGVALAAALALRIAWGFFRGLARLRLPHRPGHQGLAGLVQAIGLCAFAWMAVSGMLLWFYLEPGARAVGWMRTVKELHEGGQAVAIAYVALHAGAVLIHSLAGDPVWRRMAPWRTR
jgi:cytochrome b561